MTDIHTALIAALDDALDCDVWDAVPPGADYPYVTVDRVESINADHLALQRMEERFIYLNIWSRVQGQAEVMGIIEQIEALHEQRLETTDGYVVSVRVHRKRTRREPDNLTFMGQVTLRVIYRY